MKKPEKWTDDYANALVFYVTVSVGWEIFKARNKNNTVLNDLKNFICTKPNYEYFVKAFREQVQRETSISEIARYIPYQLLKFFFIKIRYEKEKMETQDLIGAWNTYLEVLEYDYKMDEHDKKENVPDHKRWPPQMTIALYKDRLEQSKVLDDPSLIEYFVHLSEEFLKRLRMTKET